MAYSARCKRSDRPRCSTDSASAICLPSASIRASIKLAAGLSSAILAWLSGAVTRRISRLESGICNCCPKAPAVTGVPTPLAQRRTSDSGTRMPRSSRAALTTASRSAAANNLPLARNKAIASSGRPVVMGVAAEWILPAIEIAPVFTTETKQQPFQVKERISQNALVFRNFRLRLNRPDAPAALCAKSPRPAQRTSPSSALIRSRSPVIGLDANSGHTRRIADLATTNPIAVHCKRQCKSLCRARQANSRSFRSRTPASSTPMGRNKSSRLWRSISGSRSRSASAANEQNATMCHRYLAVLAWVLFGLCVSISCRAKEAQTSFGISITILSACTTNFDEIRRDVNERCSSPLPYRIDTVRFQSGQFDEQLALICGNSALQGPPVAQAKPCGADSISVVTIVY